MTRMELVKVVIHYPDGTTHPEPQLFIPGCQCHEIRAILKQRFLEGRLRQVTQEGLVTWGDTSLPVPAGDFTYHAQGQRHPAEPHQDTSLLAMICAPVRESDMNCPDPSTHARPYAAAVLVQWPWEDLVEVRQYVQQQLEQAHDQTNPWKPAFPVLRPVKGDPERDLLASEGHVNSRFEREVGQPVALALSRCCKYGTAFTLNARSVKTEGLPDFQCWFHRKVARQGFDFMGGEGKVPAVLFNVANLDMCQDVPQIRCATEQILSYMRDKGWRWSFLSTTKEVYFIKRLEPPDTFAVSPAIYASSTNPSQREMLFYIMHKAYTACEADLERKWQASQAVLPAPGAQDGGTEAAAADVGGSSTRRRSTRLAKRTVAAPGQSSRPANTTHSFAVPGGELHLTNRILGCGESGEVLVGWYCDREAAVKLAEPSQEHYLVQQMQHEAAVMGVLKDLQGGCIPMLYGAGLCHEGGLFYLAMARASGEHPSNRLHAAMPQARKALARIHALGVLHGDIREDNILLDVKDAGNMQEDCQVWFLDFGRSRLQPTQEECQQEMDDLNSLFQH